MKKEIKIKSSDGKTYSIKLTHDKDLHKKLKYIQISLDYLYFYDLFSPTANPEIEIYRAHLPFAKKDEKGNFIHSSISYDTNGKKIIVLHNELQKDEELAHIMLSTLKALMPETSEQEIKEKAMHYLNLISENYSNITDEQNEKNFTENRLSPYEISQEEIICAIKNLKETTYPTSFSYDQIIKKSKIEKFFGFGAIVLFIISVTSGVATFSGSAIVTNPSQTKSFGVIAFLAAIACALIYQLITMPRK